MELFSFPVKAMTK